MLAGVELDPDDDVAALAGAGDIVRVRLAVGVQPNPDNLGQLGAIGQHGAVGGLHSGQVRDNLGCPGTVLAAQTHADGRAAAQVLPPRRFRG